MSKHLGIVVVSTHTSKVHKDGPRGLRQRTHTIYLRGLLKQSNYADKTAYTDMPKSGYTKRRQLVFKLRGHSCSFIAIISAKFTWPTSATHLE